ncbi:MAG: hypothetical protein R3C11_24175 [Planctomycetaceae bacterium]
MPEIPEITPDQIEVPKVSLIPDELLPRRVYPYPKGFYFSSRERLVFFSPWHLLCNNIISRYQNIQKRYPKRALIPFAGREDCDDRACWEGSDNQQVDIVHDYASEGWEDRGEKYPSFWDWFRHCMDEMIENEASSS